MNEIVESTYKLLVAEYGLTLTREDFAKMNKKSIGWVDKRMREGVGLPRFKKDGRSVIFPSFEVAKWLHEGNIETV